MNIKKGDNVIVKTGGSKGQKGTVLKVLAETNRVIVEGVQKVTKHQRPKTKSEKGSVTKIESSLHISNVMIVDPKTGTGTRVGKKEVDGKMVRIAKKSGQQIK